ncbi:MAG TPA: class I mannose-6-phosphate isomerase, partial [Polyangiales bacterium]|nr:class I mannose-6-phosphate isomerase [Polyangiales bacterium]
MTKLSAMPRPVLLAADNFTSPARTPWGGRRICGTYKAALGLAPALRELAIGESWELSLGPELPSRLADGRYLREAVAADPEAFLGAESAAGSSALLVKWLDAADHLSVQIHPAVDDPKLVGDETGKPECWYIVAREPGAGLYLGLRPEATLERMRQLIASDADVSSLLEFVPVEPGDFYLLQPGMAHAVGRGVTLVEPQYVAPGRRGVTLRYWDWNRRYDEQGKLDPKGKPRELHVERALEVTDWARTSDPVYLAAQRCRSAPIDLHAAARCDVLCGTDAGAPVRSDYLRAARVTGGGDVQLPDWNTLRALTVIDGAVELRGAFEPLRVARGQTAALPARATEIVCRLEHGHALLS